ncbi:MAG: tRNA (adenosine(37)-N6)-threonylcarbamoyltransferase complex transferase subunit TsaD [Chlamydiota bacterium]
MLVLGIESTCDETACAVVRSGKKILSNVIASQTDLHEKFGGVFPELACRRHLTAFLPILKEALKTAGIAKEEIDLIAVAKGPGLIGPLLLGLNAAKALSFALEKPFIGVNHVEAHLYASIMAHEEPLFPSLGVVVSGGHTFLVRIHAIGSYELIGTTVDDALGEAFDKVAIMLGLSYPGGPALETMALEGDPSRYTFKSGKVKGHPWDFSFSGIKTNVMYTLKGQSCNKHAPLIIEEKEKPHIASSFQEAVFGDVISKALKAVDIFNCKAIYLGGGVSNNKRLRALFASSTVPVFFPPLGLSLDNGAMIAGLGYHKFITQGTGDSLDLTPMTRIPL